MFAHYLLSFFAKGISTAIGGIKRWSNFCFRRLRSRLLPYTLGHQIFASITWKSLSRAEQFYLAPQQICPYDNWARYPWGPSFLSLVALTACLSRKFKNLYCLSMIILKGEVSCYFRDWLIFRTETHTVKQVVVKGQLFYGIMEIPCSSILDII